MCRKKEGKAVLKDKGIYPFPWEGKLHWKSEMWESNAVKFIGICRFPKEHYVIRNTEFVSGVIIVTSNEFLSSQFFGWWICVSWGCVKVFFLIHGGCSVDATHSNYSKTTPFG